jgi:L-aspartate oxidase
VVEHAPESVGWLRELGVPFSEEDGHLHLTREGGHSARRIVHVTDATGAAVQQVLIQNGEADAEHHALRAPHAGGPDHGRQARARRAGAAWACTRWTTAPTRSSTFRAPHTILATGGAGKVYLYTTNPDTATGDGIAAAWRAGCRVTNMEFIQFHPTCLYHPHVKNFLISRSGARRRRLRLLLPDGTRFMPNHDRALNSPRATWWPARSTSR